MRLEDASPAEFLFGQSPQIDESHPAPSLDPKTNTKLDLLLILISVFYIVSVILSSYIIFSKFFRYNIMMYLGGIVFFQMFLSVLRSNILLRRYAPDLHTTSKGKISFITTQIILAGLVFTLMGGLVYLSLFYVPGDYSLLVLLSSGVFLLMIYLRYFAGIGLVSSGLGKGLLPSWGGFKITLSNFGEVTRFSGSKQNQLAMLNLGVWGLSLGLFYTQESIAILIPFSVIFLAFSFRWERINASSLLMSIRGHIQQMSPSLIPFEEFKDPIPNPVPLEKPKPTARDIIKHHGKIPTKASEDTKYQDKQSMDMTTFAVRSINRIASSIKNEIQQESEVKYCTSCGREGVKSPQNCSRCSREYSRLLQTFSD